MRTTPASGADKAVQPNGNHLYDILGNVWEWTCSLYTDSYDGSETGCVTDVGNSARRSVRGGSWDDAPRNVRSAYRFRNLPDNRNVNVGFRLVRTD